MSARFLEDGSPRHLEDNNPRNLEDALAPDAASSAVTGGAGATSLTWSHTCATYSNRLLIVGLSLLNALGQTVSGVTYNGVALTAVPSGAVSNGTGGRVELWYLLAPATGANNIVASFSASVAAVGGAESWVAVDQTTPIGTAVTASGTTNDATVTVTSRVGQYIQDVVADAAVAVTVGAGQTEEWNTGVTGLRGAGSREAGAASVVMDWTSALSALWAIAGVPIKPVSLAVALAGTTAGTASTSGALKVAHSLAGSSTGTASTTAALKVAHSLAGSSTGTASTSGALKVAHSLAGTTAGTASTSGTLKVAHSLAGSSTGTASTSGALKVAHSLAGTTAGTASTTGALKVAHSLAGTTAGTASTTGALKVAHSLAGTTNGTSTATGSMVDADSLAGTTNGTATTVGALKVAHALAGTTAGTSTTIGALKVVHQLAGTTTGTATTSGTLTTETATPVTGAGRAPNYQPPRRVITRRTRDIRQVVVTSTWAVTMATRRHVGAMGLRSRCSVLANNRHDSRLRRRSSCDLAARTTTTNATAYRSGLAFAYPAEHNEDHGALLLLSLAD